MIDITRLPSLPLVERHLLPNVSAVYFALASDGSVLYIGQARRLVLRWKNAQHHRYAQLAAMPGVRLAWVEVAEYQLDAIEQECVACFAPPLNRAILTMPKAPRAKPGRKGGGVKAEVGLSADVLTEAEAMAEKENRSLGNMLATLVSEAVRRRFAA